MRGEPVARLEGLARNWLVEIDHRLETPTSILAFGTRLGESVVLKAAKIHDDEWRSGEVLAAFGGIGAARVMEHVEGAVLMERAVPGDVLARMSLDGHDDEATRMLAELIASMRPRMLDKVTTVRDHGAALERCAGDESLGPELLQRAKTEYAALCASQGRPCLLHGDLHHYNVIRDAKRGWLAIDPKGLVGELEYEVGAALRNPYERPELLADPATIKRRIRCFETELALDGNRILRWAFAQAVLAAAWELEEGQPLGPESPWIALAQVTHRMLFIC
jgi:streptomycin 6-kinase